MKRQLIAFALISMLVALIGLSGCELFRTSAKHPAMAGPDNRNMFGEIIPPRP